MVRTEPTAEDSFAAIFERSKFGIAMAAMIRMIATTISNSIREKPFCFFMMLDLLEKFYDARAHCTYRKPETNVEIVADRCFPFRIGLIINTLMNLPRLKLPCVPAQKWAKPVKVAPFCRSLEAFIVTSINHPPQR